MGVTAKDLAKKLGMSPSAVSLALNGKPGVSEKNRERILEAAIKYGYSKHPVSLGTGGVKRIRYVIYVHADTNNTVVHETSFHSIVMKGVDEVAKKQGYNVLMSFCNESDVNENRVVQLASDVQGIILLATEISSAELDNFKNLNVPVVLVDNWSQDMAFDSIVNDNFYGAYHAVAHLIEQGHTDILFLDSHVKITQFRAREAGAKKAMLHPATQGRELRRLSVGIASETAYYDICAWLDAGHHLPSAFFAANDVIAASCIRALHSRGIRVPTDVSVIGFDDLPICNMIEPSLTTICLPKEEMGRFAMRMLHDRINEPNRCTIKITLSNELRIRKSVTKKISG